MVVRGELSRESKDLLDSTVLNVISATPQLNSLKYKK